MSRYIDADALEQCMKIVHKANKDSVEFNKRCRATDVFMDIWDMIKNQPTVVDVKLLEDGTLMLDTDELDKINRVMVSQGTWCKVFYQGESDAESEPIPHWRGQDGYNLPFQLKEGDEE